MLRRRRSADQRPVSSTQSAGNGVGGSVRGGREALHGSGVRPSRSVALEACIRGSKLEASSWVEA